MALANPILDDDRVALLEGFISIAVGSRSRDLLPSLGRGIGLRVSRERGTVTVFLPRPKCAPLLADLEASGVLAAVFTQPDTHRTVQFKATDAKVQLLGPGDWERVERYCDIFATRLDAMGYPELTIRAALACPPTEIRAVTFTPSQAFDQTPGPSAGAPIGDLR